MIKMPLNELSKIAMLLASLATDVLSCSSLFSCMCK